MTTLTTLAEVESVYRHRVSEVLDNNELTATLLVDLSLALFQSIKFSSLPDVAESDMLLFQYGVHNWRDDWGEHFSLDVTRQFIEQAENEPFQLRFTLIYEPEKYGDIKSYGCWSMYYPSLDEFATHIKRTEGFTYADGDLPKAHSLYLTQC